ncbi:WYL domain-containing protein [Nocardioides zeae]|uniref:WYL domain-containing protein n=1 Tax=Nocardioides imazamoxiresistens TaxID=3231893 RepID=A0ABU3PT00_9ACTN|nr:WYL domain-containing protein [Nocardioides zeae]MDT9592324.1 WYL domain-containing protein [Nocardioides zeae]
MSAPSGAGARDQVGRMLALVPYLNARGSVHVDEASRDLGVPAQQIVQDLRVLFLCGLPGGYPDDLIDVDIEALTDADGDGVIRMSNADYLSRPLRLAPTEASALVVALRVLDADPGLPEATRASLHSALAKLEGALGQDRPRIEAGDTDPGQRDLDELAGRVEDALAAGEQLRITYHVPARDELVERTVDPWALVRRGGVAYLEAWCHLVSDERSFRLDRVHHAVRLTTPVEHRRPPVAVPDGQDPAGEQDQGATPGDVFPRADETLLATLRLAPPARWVPDYYRTEAVRPQEDGTLEIDLRVADPRWLERLVLRLAPHATVLDPTSVSEQVTASAQRTLRLYEGGRVG